MKKMIVGAALAFASMFSVNAQDGINYQAVVRDASGTVLANQNVSVEFRIKSTSTSGTTVYAETQSLTTNTFGNVVAIIGQGTATLGVFNNINWSEDDHFLNVLIDGTDMGTTQFMSVPYAMSANMAKNGVNRFEVDSTIMITSGSEANFIKTGADGKLYFQQNGSHNLNNASLILDDDSKTVSRAQTGVDHDLLPIAYGRVNSSGTLVTGTSNIGTITNPSTGRYHITITGESINNTDYVFIGNTNGDSDKNVSFEAYGGNLAVFVDDVDLSPSSLANGSFSFMIYKP